MALTQIGDHRQINLDNVSTVETNVRALHPDRTRAAKDSYVDNAVRVGFVGQFEPILLFDAEADAFLKASGYKAPDPPKPEPEPTPEPVVVKASDVFHESDKPAFGEGLAPTPKPADVAPHVTTPVAPLPK